MGLLWSMVPQVSQQHVICIQSDVDLSTVCDVATWTRFAALNVADFALHAM